MSRSRTACLLKLYLAAAVLGVLLAAGGCSTFFAVKDQQRLADMSAVIAGTVETEGEASGPLIVAIVDGGPDNPRVVDYFVAPKPGPWVFNLRAGTYWLAAFEDANDDFRYDDEPAFRVRWDQPIDLEEGAEVTGVEIRIPEDGRFDAESFSVSELARRAEEDQRRISLFALGTAGAVTTLDDPRFSRENANEGMWKFYDFLLKYQPGIYFLQEYDPGKIPVIFVHGINGTPLDFRTMIEGLDRERFQPWVFNYPSGAVLDGISEFLSQLFSRLRHEYSLDKVVVVAHSMGGLVARDFILNDFERNRDTAVVAFVTISSPFGGMASAAHGVDMSPVVVDAWRGLAPGNPFLEGLFYKDTTTREIRRRLPPHVAYHVMFGFHGDSGDGVVALSSQLRDEVQDEARTIRGFDEDHAGILQSPEALAFLNRILSGL